MSRSRCETSSPRTCLLILATFSIIAVSYGGPLPDANVTSTEIGTTLAPGSCARGPHSYRSGESFPGSDPCERCSCSSGEVSCTRETCAPRPGCKAVHRPDHCCPTYQCECEQEGRVYGNGEKLVDPQDPCRVCYCQGGEVVCRRIACFLRDDCRPRLVPGRCCPEYDNCPLRGVTAIPGAGSSVSPAIEDVGTTPTPAAASSPAPEKVKQEITIKEITPVSEIPVITDVKIKEILPSPSIEVIEYPSSSKSPLIPREATTEKSSSVEPETATPVISDNSPSSSYIFDSSTTPPETNIKSNSDVTEMRPIEDLYPSKISLSTQDAINSDIYPSNPSVTVHSSSSPTLSTSKAPVIEEEETPVEHNPAFPPLPDDLSVLSNHEDEISPEPSVSMDTDHNEHVIRHDVSSSAAPLPESTTWTAVPTTVTTTTTSTKSPAPTTIKLTTTTAAPTTTTEAPMSRSEPTTNLETKATKVSPMLNLRSAIPTEILSVPSSVSEVITGELDELEEPSTTSIPVKKMVNVETPAATTSFDEVKLVTSQPIIPEVQETLQPSTTSPISETTSPKLVTETTSTSKQENLSTSYISKSNVATDVDDDAHTELSSLPIETSDQNPPATSANEEKDKITSTEESLTVAPTSIKVVPTEAEFITVSRDLGTEKQFTDNVETTEFVITSFGSSESVTSAVELIKISNEPNAKNAAIVEPSKGKKNSILADLINLVGDVASISNNTVAPTTVKQPPPSSPASPTGIPDSEELIPVNAGYKSKINNFNLNSITEVPYKSKTPTAPNKVKGVEIEDDEEAESITDLPSPSKAEPTTRRPIIDNVDDTAAQNNMTAQKDIEIITKSYVPTIARRPTKVIMKKNKDPVVTETVLLAASGESATEEPASTSAEVSTSAPTSAEASTTTPTSAEATTPAPTTPARAPSTPAQ